MKIDKIKLINFIKVGALAITLFFIIILFFLLDFSLTPYFGFLYAAILLSVFSVIVLTLLLLHFKRNIFKNKLIFVVLVMGFGLTFLFSEAGISPPPIEESYCLTSINPVRFDGICLEKKNAKEAYSAILFLGLSFSLLYLILTSIYFSISILSKKVEKTKLFRTILILVILMSILGLFGFYKIFI